MNHRHRQRLCFGKFVIVELGFKQKPADREILQRLQKMLDVLRRCNTQDKEDTHTWHSKLCPQTAITSLLSNKPEK